MSGGPQKKSLLARLFTRTTRTSRTSWDWALGWKDFHQVGGGFRSVFIKLGLYGLLFGGIFYSNNSLFGADFFEAIKTTTQITAAIIFWFILPLELCFLAAKLFRPELNDHTWSTLLSLPMSLPEIAYSKLAGAMLSLIPSVIVLSACAAPFVGELFRDVLGELTAVMWITYMLSAVLLGLHLITFFSISIDWAAWPIAIVLGVGVCFVGNLVAWLCFGMLTMVGGSGGGEGIIYVILMLFICANLTITGLTHHGISLRLTSKGAES